jgi:thioredoxin-related protein
MIRTLATAAAMVLIGAHTFAAELGDDGLHKAPWQRETFKDLSEDLAEAQAEGRRLMVIIEQRGCIYCSKMYEEVFPVPDIETMLENDFFVVQVNMFGDVDVTDFDGTTLPEKDMVRHWGVNFTPTILFYPTEVAPDVAGTSAAAVTMPGAFGRWTTQNMLTWVLEEGYLGEESFQKYHARRFAEQTGN